MRERSPSRAWTDCPPSRLCRRSPQLLSTTLSSTPSFTPVSLPTPATTPSSSFMTM